MDIKNLRTRLDSFGIMRLVLIMSW